MARSMRSLLQFNLASLRNPIARVPLINGKRFLYTEEVLGIPNYLKVKSNYQRQFINVESTFYNKMQEICEDESSMIFTEDLKAMLHLVEKKPENLELVVKMMKKFNGQNKELRFGKYVFGPVVMRALYNLNEADLALSVFNDPSMESFFDQFISYQILMCLLFKNGKYSEMKGVYDKVNQKVLHGVAHPKKIILLLMAGCYKENTPESLAYALKIYNDASSKNINIMRRTFTFISALAINQNAPHIALEILSTMVKTERYIDVRCLKILACIELGRLLDIISIIRPTLEADSTHKPKETYFYDVIERLEQEISKQETDELAELAKLVQQLKLNNHVTTYQTLSEHLLKPIVEEQRKTDGGFFRDGNLRNRNVREIRPQSNLRDLL